MDTGKRSILLPPPPKIKKEEKTYCFALTLGESTDASYPEFSWKDLVQEAQRKELEAKAEKGGSILNPYASDDDEDLKAMAARLEQKYNKPTSGKRKRKAEDYIDRGAGYDESDSFIDNTDIYDEVVPEDLQPVLGGFYINSGPLDFKEVEVSDCDVDEEIEELHKARKIKKVSKQTPDAPNAIKRRRISNTSGSSGSKKMGKPKSKGGVNDTPKSIPTEGNHKIRDTDKASLKKKSNMTISSSSDSSSSSEDSSSSSSTSTSEEKTTPPVDKRPPSISAHPLPPKLKKMSPPQPINSQAPNPPRRLKLKNVPLNPKLHGGKTATPEPLSKLSVVESTKQVSSAKPINVPAELASAFASNLANSQLYKSMPELQIKPKVGPRSSLNISKPNEVKQTKARKSEGTTSVSSASSSKMNLSLNIPPMKTPQTNKPRKPRVSSSGGVSNSIRQNSSQQNTTNLLQTPVSSSAAVNAQLQQMLLLQHSQAIMALQNTNRSSQSKTDLLRTTQLFNSVSKASTSSAISINQVDAHAALKSFQNYPNHLNMNAFAAAGLPSLANIGELNKKTKQTSSNKVQPPLSISPLSATVTSSSTPPLSRPNSASPVNQIQNRISPSITITPHQGSSPSSNLSNPSNKFSHTNTSNNNIFRSASTTPSSTPSPHNYPKMNKPHITGFDVNSLLSTNPSSSSSSNKINQQKQLQQQQNYYPNPRNSTMK